MPQKGEKVQETQKIEKYTIQSVYFWRGGEFEFIEPNLSIKSKKRNLQN